MWNRADLKSKAKFSFKRNYWKSVLISLLLALLVGGGTSASSFSSGLNRGLSDSDSSDDSYNYDEDYFDDYNDNVYSFDYNDLNDFQNGFKSGLRDGLGSLSPVDKSVLAIFGVTFGVVFLLIMIVGILLDVFICNPIEVGCKRFYLRNLNEPAQVGNVGYAFDNNYKNIAKTMFFRDLYTALWSLLFVIPGIVKSYEYRMIPYLLAENPQMTREQAFAESKRMMTGQKWSTFVLDLSFIGWDLLSGITLGILGIFYVKPYTDATQAALYERLRYGNPYGAPNGFNGMPNNFNGAPNGFNGMPNNFNGAPNGFNGMPNNFNGTPNGFNGMPQDPNQ